MNNETLDYRRSEFAKVLLPSDPNDINRIKVITPWDETKWLNITTTELIKLAELLLEETK